MGNHASSSGAGAAAQGVMGVDNEGQEVLPPLKRGFSLRRSRRLSKRFRSNKSMDRLRRSFRESFRRKKDSVSESGSPQQWQSDEVAVRQGNCSFHVKYLGCVEVFESRGMTVCEEALKTLRNSRKRPVKGVLFVTGDGLRVVDDETKDLIVDQTIEKVSFCAPDRNHEKGFSYICRDGTTRRWMCHGFLASRDSGERLSHAVGCAFAVCLERKQTRDKEAQLSRSKDSLTQPLSPPMGAAGAGSRASQENNNFRRAASMRCTSAVNRSASLADPQEGKPSQTPPIKAVVNPYAIERPHATPSMLERQGSFRGLGTLGAQSPFKRQLSLGINDLPSNRQRQRSMSLDTEAAHNLVRNSNAAILESSPLGSSQTLTGSNPSNPGVDAGGDSSNLDISAMCQQLSMGLNLLTSSSVTNPVDPFDSPPHQNNTGLDSTCLGSNSTALSSTNPWAVTHSEPTHHPLATPPSLPISPPLTLSSNQSARSPRLPHQRAGQMAQLRSQSLSSASDIPRYSATNPFASDLLTKEIGLIGQANGNAVGPGVAPSSGQTTFEVRL